MGNNQVKGASLQDNLVQSDKKGKAEDKYNIVEQALANGKSTQIKRATSKKYTKTNRSANDGVAIKLYNGKAEIPPDLKQEASILSQCDHPNIIKLYETTQINKHLSLVLELCTGGALNDRMPYTEKRAATIMRQVCSAVSYLHQKNIVHRDISLLNILFETKEDDSDVKLIDFGCATYLELVPGHTGAFKFLKEKTGQVQTMAPEVIKCKYGPKCDVWSIGVTTKMLLDNGEAPFKGNSV
jgi:serine/threonine protein kinase